jgi:hypothetical protein
MHTGESGAHHVVRLLAYVVGPNPHLVVSIVDFFFSSSSISRKSDVAKMGPFDVLKVRESQKHAKIRKCAS